MAIIFLTVEVQKEADPIGQKNKTTIGDRNKTKREVKHQGE